MVAPALVPTSFGDLQAGTTAEFHRGRWVDLTTDIQEYTVMDYLLRQGNTVTLEGGKSIQWEVQVNHTGTAANVPQVYQDSVRNVDTMVNATADWRFSKVDSAHVPSAIQMNSGANRINDIELQQKQAARIAMVALMESNVWGSPVASTDTVTPWGFNTWLAKNATEGLTGTVNSGVTTTIGLSTSLYSRWRNWAFPYTSVDDNDFVPKLQKAITFTGFKSPVDGSPLLANGVKYQFFSNWTLIGPLNTYLKRSNQDLGLDLDRYNGATIINRMPLRWVPYLEADTTGPIYGINMSAIKLYRLANFWAKKWVEEHLPGMHMVKAEFEDYVYQFVCLNKRLHFVGSNGTSFPS